MKTTRTRWKLLLLPLIALLSSACETSLVEDIFATDDEDRPIDIFLRNLDTQNVHLFSRGEGFPCCQVAPNGTRSVRVLARPGEVIEFQAGRNGQIIDTQSCTVHDLMYPGSGHGVGSGGDVEWLITEDLRCTGHWD
jgi:hypothetical protein